MSKHQRSTIPKIALGGDEGISIRLRRTA